MLMFQKVDQTNSNFITQKSIPNLGCCKLSNSVQIRLHLINFLSVFRILGYNYFYSKHYFSLF